jgi:hypothetical protein
MLEDSGVLAALASHSHIDSYAPVMRLTCRLPEYPVLEAVLEAGLLEAGQPHFARSWTATFCCSKLDSHILLEAGQPHFAARSWTATFCSKLDSHISLQLDSHFSARHSKLDTRS